MTTVQTNEKTTAAEPAKAAVANGRKDEAPKPTPAPAPVQATAPEVADDTDETPDRFEVLAKVVRILKPLPAAERVAVIASLTEMVR